MHLLLNIFYFIQNMDINVHIFDISILKTLYILLQYEWKTTT